MRILLLSLVIPLVVLAACDESQRDSGSSGPPGTLECVASGPPNGPPPAGPPAVDFATYLGANNTPGGHPRPGEDTIRDVAIDAAGNVYVSGGTANSAFPVLNAHQGTFGGGEHDVIVAKFSPQGALLWSTFLGGANYDRAYAIELDASGNVYVAGRAGRGFPTQKDATAANLLQTAFAGDNNPNALYGEQDGFVAKFANDGTLVWSTYLGGPGDGFLRDMDVDAAGNVFVTVSEDADSPWVTAGAFQDTRPGGTGRDAIVGKLLSNGSAMEWCSYIIGSGFEFGTPSIRVDGSGYVYILGGTSSNDLPTTNGSFQPDFQGTTFDVALFKFLPDGSDVVYGAYVGGTGNEFTETHGLAVDGAGRAIVGLTTTSNDFPTSAGAYQPGYAGSGAGRGNYPGDGLLMVVSADGACLHGSTYFGGSDGEGLEGISLGPNGEIVIGGATYSSDLPIANASDAYQPTKSGGADQFLAVFNGDLSELYYSTFIGGSGNDLGRSLVTDGAGTVAVGGQTDSTNFPVSNAYQAVNAGGIYDGVLSVFTVPTP